MPGVYIGTSPLKAAYVGTTPVKEIYVGTTKVRPSIQWNGDITNKTLVGSTSISGFTCYAPCLSDDGTKLYYVNRNDNANGVLYQYSLGTAWDVSTKASSYTYSKTIGSGSPRYGVYVKNIIFRKDGKNMYIAYSTSASSSYGYIEQFSLSTAWNINTATSTKKISVGSWIHGLYISQDGTKLWYNASSATYYKQLTTAYTIETGTTVSTNDLPRDFVSTDGKYCYYSTDNVYQYSLGSDFDFTNRTLKAQVSDGSGRYGEGCWFNLDGTRLYTIRGGLNSQKIYSYTIS